MKRKNNLLLLLAVPLVAVAYAAVSFNAPSSESIAENSSEILYSETDQENKASRSTATKDAEAKADAPGVKQPSVEVARSVEYSPPTEALPKAPKQMSVRQSVAKEHMYFPLLTANDPAYASSWALQKVKAPEAWDIATGNGQTVVAVIDSGFALNHNDLKNTWFENTGETGTTVSGGRCWNGISVPKNANSCDDDNNGYVDDWRGWNFSLGDNDPSAGRFNANGAAVAHGTQVAGLVGATGNNSTGIATLNWNTKIMPLQALSDDGPGYTSDIAAAIYYAVDNGAEVINMSLGGDEPDADLELATEYAFERGVVVVAASGNCGTGTESGCEALPAGFMGYPALNDHVIAVGATTSTDQRANFSSYGPALDVVAPGSGTISTPTWTPSNATSLYTGSVFGTSYSSPQVASLASLIKSIRPNSSVDDITALILASSTKPTAMGSSPYTTAYGHGLINAYTALTVAASLNNTSARPELLQAGGVASEHGYTSADTLGSGCRTAVSTYCTVWLRDEAKGYDRYLPYQQSNPQGLTGWTWSGTLIPSGEWSVRASQGDNRSGVYYLFSK